MHSPGVCGAILAEVGASAASSRAQELGALISALNADTEMVLVAAAEAAEVLAPAVWAHAAYMVQLAPGATEADGLRALLQEALNRGRDAVLVTTIERPVLTAEIVRSLVAAYRTAGHEIWAVILEGAMQGSEAATVYPVLLGRGMIELFLRGREWRSAQEVLSANRQHVLTLSLSQGVPDEPSVGSLG